MTCGFKIMKGNQNTMASALKETVKLFCQSWIEYQDVLILDGDLKIKYDERDAIIIRFDEKLYCHADSSNASSNTNPAAETVASENNGISDCLVSEPIDRTSVSNLLF